VDSEIEKKLFAKTQISTKPAVMKTAATANV